MNLREDIQHLAGLEINEVIEFADETVTEKGRKLLRKTKKHVSTATRKAGDAAVKSAKDIGGKIKKVYDEEKKTAKKMLKKEKERAKETFKGEIEATKKVASKVKEGAKNIKEKLMSQKEKAKKLYHKFKKAGLEKKQAKAKKMYDEACAKLKKCK